MRETNEIQSWHAHVYFDAETAGKARRLCETARDRLGVEMGRVHEKQVGPHPMWSCQLAFRHSDLADVLSWLALNRDGLIVFAHPQTGDDMADHAEHAVWMGGYLPLKLEVFG
jgi:DOPA 4,5-dioxygenase